MNTTIGERFARLIEAKHLTVNGFANSLSKPYTSIKVIVDGTSKPGFDLLERVLNCYGDVSRDWLIMGEGDMFRSLEQVNVTADNYLHEHLQTLESNFSRLAAQLESKDQQIAGLQRMLEAVLGKSEGANLDQLCTVTGEVEVDYPRYVIAALVKNVLPSIFLSQSVTK